MFHYETYIKTQYKGNDMNRKLLLLMSMLVIGTGTASAIDISKAPKMKMTTDIPSGLLTPDHMKTKIGELNSDDGVPTVETAELVYDYLDFQHGVTAFLSGIPYPGCRRRSARYPTGR